MHLAIAVCSILLAWFRGDWKHFGKYHKTLLYVAVVSLMYEFITQDYMMWDFKHDFPMPNTTITDLIYIFISQPCTILVYLSNYPEKPSKQALHILKWILIYVVGEMIEVHYGRIHYEHGWNIWWSIMFDCVMFPIIRLHFTKPQWAYPISVIVVASFVWGFHVSMK